MKKLLILALVLIVAGGLFAQAAGPQVIVGGQVNYGIMANMTAYSDLKNLSYAGPGEWANNWINVIANIDPFTQVYLRVRNQTALNGAFVNQVNAAVGTNNTLDNILYFRRAWVQTDLAGTFGLDKMGLKLITRSGFGADGLSDWHAPDGISPANVADASSVQWGSVGKPQITEVIGIKQGDMFGDLRFTVWGNSWAPIDIKGKGPQAYGAWAVAVDGGYGPFGVGVSYTTVNKSWIAKQIMAYDWAETYSLDQAKGNIAFDAKYTQAFGDIALAAYAGGAYDLTTESMMWGLAARVGYQTFANIKLGFGGATKQAKDTTGVAIPSTGIANTVYGTDTLFSRAELLANIMPVSFFSLDIGTVLNIDKDRYVSNYAYGSGFTDTSMLQEFVVRANIFANKTTKLTVGYHLVGVEGYSSAFANEQGWVGSGKSITGKGGIVIETLATF